MSVNITEAAHSFTGIRTGLPTGFTGKKQTISPTLKFHFHASLGKAAAEIKHAPSLQDILCNRRQEFILFTCLDDRLRFLP